MIQALVIAPRFRRTVKNGNGSNASEEIARLQRQARSEEDWTASPSDARKFLATPFFAVGMYSPVNVFIPDSNASFRISLRNAASTDLPRTRQLIKYVSKSH